MLPSAPSPILIPSQNVLHPPPAPLSCKPHSWHPVAPPDLKVAPGYSACAPVPELASASPPPPTDRAPGPSQLAVLGLPSVSETSVPRAAEPRSSPGTAIPSIYSLFLRPVRGRPLDSRDPKTTEPMASSSPSPATSSNAGADPNATNLRPTSRSCPSFLLNGLRRGWGRWHCGRLRCRNAKGECRNDGGWETNGALSRVPA